MLGTPNGRPGPHRVAPVDIPPAGRPGRPGVVRGADGVVFGKCDGRTLTTGCPAVIAADGPTIADKLGAFSPVVVAGLAVVVGDAPTCPVMGRLSAVVPEKTGPPAVAVPPMLGTMTTGAAKPGNVVVGGVVAEPIDCAHDGSAGTIMLTARRIAALRFMPWCPYVSS